MSEVQEQRETTSAGSTEEEQHPQPHLSTSVCYLLVAGWLAWIVSYANLTGTIFASILYALAFFSLFVSICFFIGELRRTPQLRRFLAEILPLKDVLFPWRPTADVWSAGVALGFFLGLCVLIHFVAITWLGWTGVRAAVATSIVIFLAACAAAITYSAVEEHIIKPFLHFLTSDDEGANVLARHIRKLVLAIAGALGFFATVLQLNDYFR